MSIHGLPTKTRSKNKSKTIDGFRYVVKVKHHYTLPVGFNMFKYNKTTKECVNERFHNGKGFSNIFSIEEALTWAINNL